MLKGEGVRESTWGDGSSNVHSGSFLFTVWTD